jgi:3-oxoacyl-[acyl-carrier protein] reductase
MYANKTVLVTGSSRGVGLGLARHFIDNNATVIGISRGENTNLVHERYHHYSVDLSDPQEITDRFRKDIGRDFKAIDIVINNAAVMTSQYAMIMPLKNVLDMVNVNLVGVFLVSREAAKLMRDKKPGRIINIGSMASSLEPAGDAIYAATKSAIHTLANVLAKELSTMNITCNTLAISAIETDMLNSHSDTAKEKIKDIISSLTVPRVATMDDVINVIDFFSSEKSSYITGQVIYLHR